MMIMVKYVFLFVNHEALVIANSKVWQIMQGYLFKGGEGTHLGAGVDINILTSD
jgi:hypothetical protein